MDFNDLLIKQDIDPATVLVLRHTPRDREFRRKLPWLAADHPDLFNVYQQTQSRHVEGQMRGAEHVASFIGLSGGRAVFVGLYRCGLVHPLTYEQYWETPEHQQLRELGERGFQGNRDTILSFDLEREPFYEEWKGRLVVHWPPPPINWSRWAQANKFPIFAIHESSILNDGMPSWDELVLTIADLVVLPTQWETAIGQWRGIYFILDETDGTGYIGSAYGVDNIYGRWMSYAQQGHGGNVELQGRDPTRFRFSILQLVSPDESEAEVLKLEAAWKRRLHTREFGLNRN